MAENQESNISSVVRTYSNRLFGFIRNRVPNNADAEDILQEVWYQLSKVVEIESIEQMSGWLFKVARNRITDNYRKKKEDSLEGLYNNQDDAGSSKLAESLLAEIPNPEDEELRQLFWEQLFVALDELPQKQKEVFIWNEIEDQTFQQIADRTGENIKTLISRKRYAVQHLRERLEDLYLLVNE